ncbi:GMC family oxidoreductase [Nocardia terpenica]|uniref:Choline dehydrogenase n=1 Tax=Nocardia terpenica TaxID=455432 RepID=A0A6G9YZW7_9NOCA|nr:GMC oxidoreductase [Nocardia terpenica]QIS18875.1 choline dehydrogenase [Nocardia terpenica]
MSRVFDFDDLVIGAGAAGVPLAVRLSEDPGRRVGLVDAGPYYPTVPDMPDDLLTANIMSMSQHDWQFSAHAAAGRAIRFPRGRVVGGSSAVGGTVALRGIPADFDEWAEGGNPEWSWEKILPYYRMLEDDLDFGGEFHGKGGPIPIRRFPIGEMSPVQRHFLQACQDYGFPWVDDQNHPDATGVGAMPSNRRDPTTRVSTSMGYLPAARGRENLTIIPTALVGRVCIRDGRAYGVELVDGPSARELTARRIILATGTIGTPTVLLRSGIGPADDLRELGMPVESDLPGVGAGLNDHPRTGVFMTPKPGAENFGEPVGQTVCRATAKDSDEPNDMHYYMVNGFDLTQQFPDLRSIAGGDRIFGVMVVDQRPRARGRVTLASTDPRQSPRIDLNYLSDEHDYRTFADGLRTAWELANAPAIRALGEKFVLIDESTLESEEALREYSRQTVDSTYHPVGTAKMGPSTDPAAVVDQYGAVHGVEGLHVADASIMPSHVRANTNLTSIMIGERAAELFRRI